MHAASPRQPPESGCPLVTVKGAVLTPLRRGELRTTESPRRWITGAVHDAEGRLLPVSQRMWSGDPRSPVAADPDPVRVPKVAEELSGTWLYAGHWFPHFGHFLLETLTNLWPDPTTLALDGVVAHRGYRGDLAPAGSGLGLAAPEPPSWQRELLRLAGYGDLELRKVRGRPARVEQLLVPARPVVLKSWAKPPAVEVWRRIAGAVEPGPDKRVFLSRKLFHADRHGDRRRVRVREGWDDKLECVFDRADFRVVHPETLPMVEQIAIARGATVLAGSSGSALHLAAFADPGTRVLEVGDTRSDRAPMPAQGVIDAACGHLSAFVAYGDLPGLRAVVAAALRQ